MFKAEARNILLTPRIHYSYSFSVTKKLSICTMQIIIGLAHYPQTNVLFKADEVGNMVVDMKADKVDMMFWF